jgi:prepilin-type N-terminal cleavage/methylation domain-containing protein
MITMKAFTLIETLIVSTIILILVSMIYPSISGAKEVSRKAVSISNMRQCYLGINMYSNENECYPTLEIARKVLPANITRDPNDYWRNDNNEDWPLLLGSYGYIFSDDYSVDYFNSFQYDKNLPLLVSIFYSNPKISPFKGDEPPLFYPEAANLKMPSRVLVLREDGSVSTENVHRIIADPTSFEDLTWSSLFFTLIKYHE